MRKGIILAGGVGARLLPLTHVISKQLLPIYDKPMVYYPLSVLMLCEIREILLISTPRDLPLFKQLLGDGHHIGLHIEYAAQPEPKGIAEALLIGESFVKDSSCMLILGDNFFYGGNLVKTIEAAFSKHAEMGGAGIFSYHISNPQEYGVVEFDQQGRIISIEEKPAKPKSRHVITGLYLYDQNAIEYAKQLKFSARGELEITDLNKMYLQSGKLTAFPLGRGVTWLDTGTPDSLLKTQEFVRAVQDRQGFKIAALEEVAYRKGWIDAQQLMLLAKSIKNSYGQYLQSILAEDLVVC